MAQPAVYAGWRTVIKYNNNLFAAGYVLDYQLDTDHNEIQGLDNVYPDEYAPSRIGVSMNMRVFRTPDNDPVVLGIAPGGDSVDGGETRGQTLFTSSKYITVEIRDRQTDLVILFLPKAVLVRRTGQGEAENLISENWSIRSIGFFGPGAQRSSLFGNNSIFANL